MNIGLLGFGVVGRGVYEITSSREDMQVTKVLCLEDINLPDAESVKDINLIVNDESIDTVVEAMGGAEMFTRRLLWACEHSVHYYNDDHGKEGYLNFTNEPSFHIPWLFCTDEIRRPDLAAKCIDRVIKRFSLPHDYPGDEDNGGMSSYYIFLMCGIFPYATTFYYEFR